MDIACCQLDGNADAVEFCPCDPFHHILAAATYTLQEGAQPLRTGSISLFSTNAETGLGLLHRVQTAGVFDIKWNPSGGSSYPLLAQADADGCVVLRALQSNQGAEDQVSRRSPNFKLSLLKTLPERFRHKVAAIETVKHPDEIKVEELVGALQTYEITFLTNYSSGKSCSSSKSSGFALKSTKEEDANSSSSDADDNLSMEDFEK